MDGVGNVFNTSGQYTTHGINGYRLIHILALCYIEAYDSTLQHVAYNIYTWCNANRRLQRRACYIEQKPVISRHQIKTYIMLHAIKPYFLDNYIQYNTSISRHHTTNYVTGYYVNLNAIT